ncbi:hypothetical protein B0H63DRAFT_484084 [Podospora didyma]|uniref:Uncharacterized protein n=1 Tax=Podospora didyma TaxID=330526 RepID=A0AAE0K9W1_9PEZI|nr:hypothetical protein B0H63DRAFT_484084 [Podospora didyma]
MTTYFGIIRTSSKWGASPLVKRRFLHKGWCLMDIARFMEINVDGHYYLSKMPRLEGYISHEGCSERACTARNVNRETYKQRRICQDKLCEVREVDIEAMAKFTEEGDVPVFEWDVEARQLTTKRSRMVRRGVADPPFIVISHVYAIIISATRPTT